MRTIAELRGWVGRDVYDPFDRRIGVVAGLRADRATGAPEWLVVALDGDVGRLRAVPVVGAEPSGFAVRVTPAAERVGSAPPVPGEDDMPVDEDRAIAEHYGLVFDTAASSAGIPRPRAARDLGALPRGGPGDAVVGPDDRPRLIDALRDAHAIAAYDALERLALDAGDAGTAQLARDNRADEEALLATLLTGRRRLAAT